MPIKLSALIGFKHETSILLAVFCVLVIGVVFIGLDDVPGYILGYLATTIIFYIAVRGWRTIKRFLILFVVTILGAIFLSFLYVEVISRIAIMIGGAGALESTPMEVIEAIITYLILFATPVGILMGIVGSIILGIRHFTAPRGRNSGAGST
jgi:hypothetical protein